MFRMVTSFSEFFKVVFGIYTLGVLIASITAGAVAGSMTVCGEVFALSMLIGAIVVVGMDLVYAITGGGLFQWL